MCFFVVSQCRNFLRHTVPLQGYVLVIVCLRKFLYGELTEKNTELCLISILTDVFIPEPDFRKEPTKNVVTVSDHMTRIAGRLEFHTGFRLGIVSYYNKEIHYLLHYTPLAPYCIPVHKTQIHNF